MVMRDDLFVERACLRQMTEDDRWETRMDINRSVNGQMSEPVITQDDTDTTASEYFMTYDTDLQGHGSESNSCTTRTVI